MTCEAEGSYSQLSANWKSGKPVVVFLCFFSPPVVFTGRAVVSVSVQGSSLCPMERSDRLRMEISLLSPFYLLCSGPQQIV